MNEGDGKSTDTGLENQQTVGPRISSVRFEAMNFWTLLRIVDPFCPSLLADVRRACSLLPSPNPGHNRPENIGRPILALRKASMTCKAASLFGVNAPS